MYILSVDTTAKTASVCVAKDDSDTGLMPLALLTLNGMLTHSESLLPMIDKALNMSQINISDLDAMAVTAGPGSFTGVRIGVSVIKGLAFSQGEKIPCIPLSTLYCLALNVVGYSKNTIICPLMDARREQFYNAVFKSNGESVKRVCEDRVTTAQELTKELMEKYSGKKIIICGDGAKLYYNLYRKYTAENELKIVLAHPAELLQNAFSVAYAGWEVMKKQDYSLGKYRGSILSPIYLRLSQAERERNEKIKNANAVEI